MGLSTRIYKKKECITFKSTSGRYGALSNMASGFPVTINNVIIKNVELLYQALRYPNYPNIQKRIIGYSSPISAKQYARTHIEKTRDDWNEQRFKIMKFCIELKLYQNNELFGKALLSTANLPIVEFTSEDK
ncbi:MAG: NADAR family protein, partial [Flavobacterium sp.]